MFYLTNSINWDLAVKLIGKLQDGKVFLKKGHGEGEEDLFEFKTDDGNYNAVFHFMLGF